MAAGVGYLTDRPKLVAGRESGPVLPTYRRAASHRVTPAADLDPETGRARLS